MIELLLQAERALSMGLVEQAERLYRQAADADARNSIAVVGLARVALERGDDALAWREARRALAIDPENAAAQRMVDRLEEVWRHRGQALPDAEPPDAVPASPSPVSGSPAAPPASMERPPDAAAAAPSAGAPARGAPPPRTPSTPRRPPRNLVDRLLRRKRP